MSIEVTAHARLHFGFLDLAADETRRFGGIGLAIDRPRVRLLLEAGRGVRVEGPQAERIERLTERFYRNTGIKRGVRVRVMEAIPEHVGLGSGTQTSLALASGLARLHRFEATPEELCLVMGRAQRSGIGFHAFLRGGFIVEGGHALSTRPSRPPLLMRHAFPAEWRILVVIPRLLPAVSGSDEEEAFRRLPPPPGDASARMSRIVLMRLLPALVERNLPAFGTALAAAQEIVGGCFAAIQDGPFHPAAAAVARRLKRVGACGVGQSSWGPALYAFAADAAEEERHRTVVRACQSEALLFSTRGFNRGASVVLRRTAARAGHARAAEPSAPRP